MKKLTITFLLILLIFPVVFCIKNELGVRKVKNEIYLGFNDGIVSEEYFHLDLHEYDEYFNTRIGIQLKFYVNKLLYKNYINLLYFEHQIAGLSYEDNFRFGVLCPTEVIMRNKNFLFFYEVGLFQFRDFYFSLNLGYNIFLTRFNICVWGDYNENDAFGEIVKSYQVNPFYGLNIGYNYKGKFQIQLTYNLYTSKEINGNYNSCFDGDYYIKSFRLNHVYFYLAFNIGNLI